MSLPLLKLMARNRFLFVLSVTPLVHYGFTLLFYCCVSFSLGSWANTMGLHDPKSFFGGVPYNISIWLMILSFAVGPAVTLLSWRKKVTPFVLVYAFALTLDLVLFRLATPWLATWIMD
jgi:hypothetical protein